MNYLLEEKTDIRTITMANSNNQIETMLRLIDYGRNTNKTQVSNKPLLEHAVKANDGNTYGILSESGKYYIMVAPAKNSEVVAEDFKHIGGINNRKNNEYRSYSTAMENLDLKVRKINESIHGNEMIAPTVATKEAKDWKTALTEETRRQIDRFNQINENCTLIENKYVPAAHTLPEAPDKNPTEKEVNTPFTDTAVAKGDKEFTKTETNYETAGGPFNKDGEATNADMTSDKKPSGNNNGEDTYSQNAKYTPEGSVANQHPTGGKVTRADEGKQYRHHVKITEDQAKVLGWNPDKNYIDTSKGTEIGSSDPFNTEVGKQSNQTDAPTEPIHENEGIAVHNTDDQNKPTPGTSEHGDTAPYDNKVNEAGVDPSTVAGMPENLGGEDPVNGIDFDTEYDNWINSDSDQPFFNADELLNGQSEPMLNQDPLPEPTSTDGPFGESKEGCKNKCCRESKKIDGKRVLGEATENGDWHGVPGARFIWHGEWADPEIEYQGKLINYYDFADYFDSDEAEKNATPDEVKTILDEILLGMSETGEIGESKIVNEGNVDLGIGKHPAYQKEPMTIPPNKEVAPNGARDWNDDSAKGDKPFGTEIGSLAPFTDKIVKTIVDSLEKRLNFPKKA